MNKKIFNTIVIITLGVVIFLGLSKFVFNENDAQTRDDLIPVELVSLPRTTYLTGAGAMEQISMLHGKNISIEEGYVAKYQGEGKEVTLWVSASPTEEEGEDLFRIMDEKMPASKVFTDREAMKIKGMDVIKVMGMGQEHYYWVKGKYNYWVAVEGVDGKKVVEALL